MGGACVPKRGHFCGSGLRQWVGLLAQGTLQQHVQQQGAVGKL